MKGNGLRRKKVKIMTGKAKQGREQYLWKASGGFLDLTIQVEIDCGFNLNPMNLRTPGVLSVVTRQTDRHWGRGYLETGRNISGTLKGQDLFP